MRGRPLCRLAIAFAIGIATVAWVPLELSPIFIGAIFSALLIYLIITLVDLTNPRKYGLPSTILFFALGVLAALIGKPHLPAPKSLEPFIDKPDILIKGEVIESPDFYPDKLRIPLQLTDIFQDGIRHTVEGRILLTVGEADLEPGAWLVGDRLLARLTLIPFHNFNNPGGYNYVLSQAERDFYARAYVPEEDSILKLATAQGRGTASLLNSLRSYLDEFRQRALFWLRKSESPDVSSFYAALLLGYRHQLPKHLTDLVNRAGVTHLLAISGLHLGMVAFSIFWLSRWFIRFFFPLSLQKKSDHRIALWAAFMFAILYAFIGGFALPTWRAAIMLFLFGLAILQYRHPDSPSLLACAALVILIIYPNTLKQVSFQLSFAAMIGIFLVYPKLKAIETQLLATYMNEQFTAFTILKPFLSAFLLSSAVSVTVIPLTAFHFHSVSLAGLLANTLLVPLIGFFVLPIGLLSLAAFAVNQTLAAFLIKLGGVLVGFCEDLISWFGNLSWGFVWVGTFSLIWLALICALLAVLLCSWRTMHKVLTLFALSIFITVYAVLDKTLLSDAGQKLLRVTVIDVGQGSSSLVQFPNGSTMLIDGGGFFDDSFDIGRYVVAPFLWHSGIQKLDYVVLSHDHPDHRNGLQFILSHFDIGYFWETGIKDRSKVNETHGRKFIPENLESATLRLPGVLHSNIIGSCEVQVLHPSTTFIDKYWDHNDLNNVSLVLQIDYGTTSVIIPGDIDSSVERLIFAPHSSVADVLLIAPHHGSAHSNSSLLMERLKPRNIVFSCGYGNWFGFPAKSVLEECQKRNITVHRTDLHGAIFAVSNGESWKVEHYLQRY